MGYFVWEIQKLKDLCRIKSCPCYCLLLMTWFSEASLYSVMINCTPYRGKSYFSKLRRTRRFESVIAVFWTTLFEDIGDRFKLRLSPSPLSIPFGFLDQDLCWLATGWWKPCTECFVFFIWQKSQLVFIWYSIFRCTLSFLKDSVAKVFESSVYCH